MKKIVGIVLGFLAVVIITTALGIQRYDKTNIKELEDEIVVLTNYDDKRIDYIKNEFNKKTQINVKVEKFTSEEDIAKILKDGDKNIDVIMGATKETLESLGKSQLLYEYNPEWDKDINSHMKDDNGLWYGVSRSPIVLFYNEKAIKAEDVPNNLDSLNDKKYKDKLIMMGEDSIQFKYMIFTMLNQYNIEKDYEAGFKSINGFKYNIKSHKNSSYDVVKAVSDGEGDIGFAYLEDVNMAIKNGKKLKVVSEDVKYPYTITGIAISKNSKNINSAKLFEEYAGGPVVQLKLAEKYNMYPCNTKSISLNKKTQNIDSICYDMNIDTYNKDINKIMDKYKEMVEVVEITNNQNININNDVNPNNNINTNNNSDVTQEQNKENDKNNNGEGDNSQGNGTEQNTDKEDVNQDSNNNSENNEDKSQGANQEGEGAIEGQTEGGN